MIPSSPDGDEHEESYEIGDKSYWYPFKPIPDVKEFEIELNAYDPIFAMFGIKRRFSPLIKYTKYKNAKYNRYMGHCLSRLEDARIGKIVVESDFTDYFLIEASTKKKLETYDSIQSIASNLFK
jgi:hypothetical protein